MIKLLELFGGIGACTQAFKRIGVPFEIADYVEIDKYAVQSYNAINGTNFEPQDITKWDKDIEVDFIMHGSPCQDFSLAGKQAGGDENSGTRSSLMYETLRIVNKLKPKYVLWENVKNLLSVKHKHNFDKYIQMMDEGGYNSYYQVLNAKDYGIPQNRERVFTLSIRKDIDNGYTFPSKEELKLRLKDMLEKNVDEKYYLSEKQIERIHTTTYNTGKTRIQEKDYSDTLCARDYKDPKCVQVAQFSQTIMTDDNIAVVEKNVSNLRIRKLTPKECWRLMGFSDESFDKAKANGMSDSQLYKQAGNSIVVDVLEKILKNLFEGE